MGGKRQVLLATVCGNNRAKHRVDISMVKVLKERKSSNLVRYYLKDMYYEDGIMKERYIGPANLGDVAELTKQPRHVFQVIGWFIALARVHVYDTEAHSMSEDERRRISLVRMDLDFGIAMITSLTLLHAHLHNLDPQQTLDDLYFAAFRKTITDLHLEELRAIGVPITAHTVKTTMDSKGRITIPKWLREAKKWKPGDNLELKEERGRFYLESTEQPESKPDDAQIQGYSITATELIDIVYSFTSNMKCPSSLGDLRTAIDKDLDLTSFFDEATITRLKTMLGHRK